MSQYFFNNKTILDLVFENIKNNKFIELLLNNNAPHTQRQFFTLLNKNETINNIPLGTGLNVSTFKPLEKYIFCDIQNIFKYLNDGVYLRQVFLPINNPKFFVKYYNDYHKCNMMILGKKYDMREPETFYELIRLNLDIYDVNVIYWASKNGYDEVVKFLISNGANIKTAIYAASKFNQLNIIKMILDENNDEDIIITAIKCCISDNYKYAESMINKYCHLTNPEIFNLFNKMKSREKVSYKPKINTIDLVNKPKVNTIDLVNKPKVNKSKINTIDPVNKSNNLEDKLLDACKKNNKMMIDDLINKGADYKSVHKKLLQYGYHNHYDDVIKYLARIIMNNDKIISKSPITVFDV
ncbi:repeat protein [Moumouvirus goulette]|uniref:Repeat protein n=1 Tax=Moumouvirus goulette TaxID=1247379 RepID=M1NNN0_9VIRU|nr:repeat protein [Moumouvirus goulette]AGF85670.1 repeat protein [Moumouvirus goulette]